MEVSKILKVTEKLFFAKKYSDVKLDNLANELWIKKPSLYHYFIDKKDLFLQTLKYSEKNYIQELKSVTEKWNIKEFIRWYLAFPYEKKNLFGIAFQQQFCIDDKIKLQIIKGKYFVQEEIKYFLKDYWLSEIQIYLIMNLLEKLAQNNCIEWNCLKYELWDLSNEIEKLIV